MMDLSRINVCPNDTVADLDDAVLGMGRGDSAAIVNVSLDLTELQMEVERAFWAERVTA